MKKINFEDLPSTETPLNASNLNLVQDNIEMAIDDIGINKQNDLGIVLLASGKVTDKTNGTNIPVDSGSALYLVFTLNWVGMHTDKTGMYLCSNITNQFNGVEAIKEGTYAGTVTMSDNTINIKPYDSNGCQYKVFRILLF